ncbi:hypothetical protein GJU40_19120 [Bacillus lacus]|uniref:Uncharacterized protein n=1 Tax=Metabacillus lacus TaxID=1983721 RepID=A0A7X2J2G5_9BACI|nr:hypothetical protein [Metabacillus lacus]MRX74237.1 hypothetical protein [Metabacillus lacus]
MDTYKNFVTNILQGVITKYNLSIISLDDKQCFLVGKLFALSVYHITNLIQDRFTVEDRSKYGTPKNNEDFLKAQLRVWASGLFYRWDDLLSGNESWLKKYCLEVLPANQPTLDIILPVFQSQKKKKS